MDKIKITLVLYLKKENQGNVDKSNTAVFFAIELKLQQQVITSCKQNKTD